MPDDPLGLRLYRRLLKLYPAGFRETYGEAMEQAFRDELRESSGVFLWLRLLADLAVSVPAQFAREVAQDARHAFRLWGARPFHTGFAILALAIGIGANTGVFSVVNALLLRSLPFRDPGRLVSLRYLFAPHDSAAQFHAWRSQSAYLEDSALTEVNDANLGGAGEWRRAHVVQTSGNFFSLLGTQPALGRAFTPQDDVDASGWGLPGRNAVAVISYGLWQSLYGGARNVLGATIRVSGNPLTVIGVAPPGFNYPANADLWKPAAFSRGNNGWETLGRLKPGIGWAQARAAFAAEADRLSPVKKKGPDQLRYPPQMIGLRDQLAGPTRNASLVLMACVAVILLIACTNVANLLLARTADRASELSIRSALGASRARISQQLLTECVLLSLAAASFGIVVAYWTTSIASKLQPAPLATQAYSLLDVRVLCFTIAVSVLSGVLFGLLPSLYAGRVNAFGTRGSSETRSSRFIRDALVAAQVMLTLVLVTASISVGRAFVNLMHVDRGFDRSGVVTVNVSLEGTPYGSDASRLAFFQEALERIRRLPGVRSASSTEFLPLYANMFMGGRWSLDGRQANENSMVVPVFPDYFRTMGGRLMYGREFTDADLQGINRAAVVDERFASEFGPPAAAVGRVISIGRSTYTVVGVVKNMDYMAEDVNSDEVFTPARSAGGFFSTFVARVDGRPEDRLAMVRDAIQSVDRQVPLFGVKTMEQRMDEALARPQFYKTAVMCFAGFAVLLAVLGIFGIVSYTVARRTHEMGVRMALGATPGKLRAHLLGQGLIPIAAGAIPGVAGAVLSGQLLESLVEGAKSVNTAWYAAAILFLAAIAAIGIWVATRPITRLDVADILRSE
jgi:putative ABC transport system permease protein